MKCNTRPSPWEELDELLKEAGLTATFDRFRDITKGCGEHCHGWNPTAEGYCPNHEAAIERGEYKRDLRHIRKVIP